MSAITALLGRIVDYAGLFPPAGLEMESAVRNYQQYLGGDLSWMLGSFVVPAHRLEEFAGAFERVGGTEQEAPWTVSVVCAGEHAGDLRAIEEFQQGAVFLSSFEARVADVRGAEEVLTALPDTRARYVEFKPEQVEEFLPVLAKLGARAKLRTAGTTGGTGIPPVETVAQFLLACARERVAWKATAGLHAPLRAQVSTEGNAPEMMHGFVNLFLAGALAYFGADEKAVVHTLNERSGKEFQFDDDVVRWHDHTLTSDQIEQVRSEFATSFGSCSFMEPAEGLKALGWL